MSDEEIIKKLNDIENRLIDLNDTLKEELKGMNTALFVGTGYLELIFKHKTELMRDLAQMIKEENKKKATKYFSGLKFFGLK